MASTERSDRFYEKINTAGNRNHSARGLAWGVFLQHRSGKGARATLEFAIIKWDGNDKVCVNLPTKSEIVHVYELSNSRTPKDMQEEEFCLAFMANKLAKEGWDVAAFDSRRLVFRRALGQ